MPPLSPALHSLCPSLLQLHPFDTEEGRAVLTSPFAAGAFQTAIDVPDSSGSEQPTAAAAVAAAAALGAAASRGSRESRPSKFHDSAGTASGSSYSAASHRSWMAKCARIETKSLPPGGLPESALAPAGVPAGAAAAGQVGAEAAGRASLEMQPMQSMVRPSPAGQSSRASGPSASAAAAEAAALSAEEEDVVTAMLAGDMGRPFSSEGVSSEGVGLGLFDEWVEWVGCWGCQGAGGILHSLMLLAARLRRAASSARLPCHYQPPLTCPSFRALTHGRISRAQARSTDDSSGSIPRPVPELPFSDWEISPAGGLGRRVAGRQWLC